MELSVFYPLIYICPFYMFYHIDEFNAIANSYIFLLMERHPSFVVSQCLLCCVHALVRSVTSAAMGHSRLIMELYWYFKFRYEVLRVHTFWYDLFRLDAI